MIRLSRLLEEILLMESLPIEKAREYTSIKRNPKILKRLDDIFERLKSLPGTTSSRRDERIFVPFSIKSRKKSSPVEQEIVSSLPSEYKLKDYMQGIVTDKFDREVKLNKVLNRIGRPDLVTKVNSDETRQSSKEKEFFLVFSRHPYDIAGMSTNRGWRSCMNIYSGSNKKYVSADIKEGSFICYLVKTDDLNIKNPSARVLIKPYVNMSSKDDVLYVAEDQMYGTAPKAFINKVKTILDTVQENRVGVFKLVHSLYCDSKEIVWKSNENLDKILRGDAKPSTKTEVKLILDLLGVVKYKINSDLSVDVNGSVWIGNKNLEVIPVQFRNVSDSFVCDFNKLTTLEGAPKLVGGSFSCDENKLTTLKGAPKQVGGSFTCTKNQLTTLEGSPDIVPRAFDCSYNKLTSLNEAPKEVGGWFYCTDNTKEFSKADVLAVTKVKADYIDT